MAKSNKKFRISLIITGVVIATAGLAWWYLVKPIINQPKTSPAVHAYDGENNLKYSLRRGTYI